jgi:hypothetical protein
MDRILCLPQEITKGNRSGYSVALDHQHRLQPGFICRGARVGASSIRMRRLVLHLYQELLRLAD